jgi:putative intracellular protease/amidase
VDRTNEAGGCFIIDETPPPHLNEYQQQAFRASADYFNRVELHRADPVSNAAPDDLLLIITGAGGTGKTEFVKTLSAVINRKGAVVCTAPTGVAAVVLPDGHTVHSAFQIRIDQVKKGDRPYARTRKQQINNRANLQQARFKYADEMRFLVIDEFSMLEANLLAVIDERLREWTGNMNIAFGGVAVILMGDPFQLFPVGKSLISASLESLTAASFVSGTSHRTMMYHKSGLLFNKFRRIDFKISQRCLDPVLERCLLPFRSNVTVDARPVVSSGILKLLKVLKSTDATEDPAFKKAVIVVAGNEQRIKINNARAVALAKEHGKVVIAWRSRLCIADRTLLEKMANHHRTTPEALLAKQDELIMFFVEGAPAIILDNIATEVGVANGTTCTLHSLVLDPLKESTQQHWSNMDLLAPGDIYWLPDDDIPLFVNVEFHHIPAAQWDSALSIVEGRIVVPLPMCKDRECHEAKTGKLKQWNFRYHTFWLELAFAVTYYKVQGQTINRIILDLNHAGSVQKKIDLAAFYVGLSRVRHSDHIRILPLRPDTIKHLRSLHFKDCLIDWCKRGSLEFPL